MPPPRPDYQGTVPQSVAAQWPFGQTSAKCGQRAQPGFLSEVLCILGAEGCVVDVNTSVEFKVPFRTGLLKPLVFTVTAEPAILSELHCILGAVGCVVDVHT